MYGCKTSFLRRSSVIYRSKFVYAASERLEEDWNRRVQVTRISGGEMEARDNNNYDVQRFSTVRAPHGRSVKIFHVCNRFDPTHNAPWLKHARARIEIDKIYKSRR